MEGHVINSGKVELVFADDEGHLTEAPIDFANSAFHLEFVPSGEFKLKVTDLKDVQLQKATAAAGSSTLNDQYKTLRTYGDAETTLVVDGDRTDVIISIGGSKSKATIR